MDRVFLDANVLFSAAYGSPGLRRLWALAVEGECQLLTCALAAEEARRNPDTPAQQKLLAQYLRAVESVEQPTEGAGPEGLPEADGLILRAAQAGGATHFLTGDVRHFGAYYGRRRKGVRIEKPGDYLRRKQGRARPYPQASTDWASLRAADCAAPFRSGKGAEAGTYPPRCVRPPP